MHVSFHRIPYFVLSTVVGVAVIAAAVADLLPGACNADEPTGGAVEIARDGKARVPIVAGSVKEPVDELRHYLKRIVGDEFELAEGRQNEGGIYVGLLSDFRWMKRLSGRERLGSEGCWLVCRENENAVYVLAAHPRGMQHGVATLLHELGCRWFFPGEVWEVVPQRKNLSLASRERRFTPDFPTQRRIWYGYGAYGPCREDWNAWVRHNRMGGPLQVGIGHSWAGLNPEKDFEKHPEWFALVDGERQPSKPCYSHPEVLARAKAAALERAGKDVDMISMTPPDGLGYCSCERCLQRAGVEETFEEKGTLFGRRKDGALVNVTSETVFHFANEVAKAVAAKHPERLIGCYAYSAYSHPPSFDLHPNVYLQTTTAYRRTPLTLEEQVSAIGDKTRQLGIREYYSVYQWDWDYPDAGKMTPGVLKQDLSQFHRWGVTAVNAEASNNWAARGLGYYIAARLLWDVETDVQAAVRDFYENAFGPAAKPMERYYVRWYGPEAAALTDPQDLPARRQYFEKHKHDLDVLRAAYRDLDEAMKLAADDPPVSARLDHLRMYLHYLLLRYQLEQATAAGDEQAILAAVEAETIFGGRLTYTNMIHTRPLLGKAFLRRFRRWEPLLEDHQPAQRGGPWRQIGTPPDAEELDQLWAADKKLLKL